MLKSSHLEIENICQHTAQEGMPSVIIVPLHLNLNI